MRKLIPLLILLTACSAAPKEISIPDNPECHKTTSSLTLEMFQNCFPDGMSYENVAQIIGYPGTVITQSGNSKIYTWNGSSGTMAAQFINNRLVSKSQSGL